MTQTTITGPDGVQRHFTRMGECNRCGRCCEFITLQVPPEYLSNADIRRWIELHGIRLSERDGGVFARIDLPCSALTEEGLCSLMGTPERPALCSHWPATPAMLAGLEEVCSYSFERQPGPQEGTLVTGGSPQ